MSIEITCLQTAIFGLPALSFHSIVGKSDYPKDLMTCSWRRPSGIGQSLLMQVMRISVSFQIRQRKPVNDMKTRRDHVLGQHSDAQPGLDGLRLSPRVTAGIGNPPGRGGRGRVPRLHVFDRRMARVTPPAERSGG